MTAHSLPRHSSRRASRNALLELGWPHYWLLTGILGGMLGLVVLLFFIQLSTL
jgi:hypothetical protein